MNYIYEAECLENTEPSDVKFITNNMRHIKSVREEKNLFPCNDCHNNFLTKVSLETHFAALHDGKN